MSIYHQLFVNNSFDTELKISMLKPFIYTGPEVDIVKSSPDIQIQQTTAPPAVQQTSGITYPNKKDTIFWCLYIANNGMAEYESIGRGYSNVEMDEKQKITNFIRSQPSRLKNTNHKVTNINIQEIMSDIVTNKCLSLSTLVAMSVYYKKRILLTKNDKFYINICPVDDITGTIILVRNHRGDYGLDTNSDPKHIEDNMFRLDRYDRPLSAVSNYSMEELKTLALKLGVPIKDKCKKAELYQDLTIHCLW